MPAIRTTNEDQYTCKKVVEDGEHYLADFRCNCCQAEMIRPVPAQARGAHPDLVLFQCRCGIWRVLSNETLSPFLVRVQG